MVNKIILFSILSMLLGFIIILISVNLPYYCKTKRFAHQLCKCSNSLQRIGEFFLTVGIIGLVIGVMCWNTVREWK